MFAGPNMTRLGLYDSKEDIEVSYQIFKDLLKTNPEIRGMTGSSAGDVVAIGTPDEIERNDSSVTGDYLSGRKFIEILCV